MSRLSSWVVGCLLRLAQGGKDKTKSKISQNIASKRIMHCSKRGTIWRIFLLYMYKVVYGGKKPKVNSYGTFEPPTQKPKNSKPGGTHYATRIPRFIWHLRWMSTPIMNDFWACEEDEEICVYKTGNWGGNLFYIVLLFLFFVSQFFLAYGDLASECAQNSFLLRRNCKCRKHFCCCPIACSRRQGQILTYSKNAGEESKQRVIFKKSDRLRHYKIWLFGISCLMASFFPKTCTQEITLPCHFINTRNNNNSWPFYVSTSLSWFISTHFTIPPRVHACFEMNEEKTLVKKFLRFFQGLLCLEVGGKELTGRE